MKVKVCGITSVDQMRELQALGIDYAGMIFYEKSARFAGEKLKVENENVKNIFIDKIGVFVNVDLETVKEKIETFGLSAVQLHGDEPVEFCKALMKETTVIKVFRINSQQDIDALVTPFAEACHFYLFDTDTKGYGGSGKQFNWEVLQKAQIGKPFFLSGGIGLEDIEKLNAFHHPYLYAIDVNSRFETAPGVKDLEQVANFVHLLKQEQNG